MGSTKEALFLITDSLVDIHKVGFSLMTAIDLCSKLQVASLQAVSFCKEHDETELWTDLIDRSLDKPYFINVLLHNIGTHVDPR